MREEHPTLNIEHRNLNGGQFGGLEVGAQNADPIFTFRGQWIQFGDGVLGASLSPRKVSRCSVFNVRCSRQRRRHAFNESRGKTIQNFPLNFIFNLNCHLNPDSPPQALRSLLPPFRTLDPRPWTLDSFTTRRHAAAALPAQSIPTPARWSPSAPPAGPPQRHWPLSSAVRTRTSGRRA